MKALKVLLLILLSPSVYSQILEQRCLDSFVNTVIYESELKGVEVYFKCKTEKQETYLIRQVKTFFSATNGLLENDSLYYEPTTKLSKEVELNCHYNDKVHKTKTRKRYKMAIYTRIVVGDYSYVLIKLQRKLKGYFIYYEGNEDSPKLQYTIIPFIY